MGSLMLTIIILKRCVDIACGSLVFLFEQERSIDLQPFEKGINTRVAIILGV